MEPSHGSDALVERDLPSATFSRALAEALAIARETMARLRTNQAVSLSDELSDGDTFDPALCWCDPLVVAPLSVMIADLKRQVAEGRGFFPELREPLTAAFGLSTDRKWDPDDSYAHEYSARINVPSPGADGVVVEEEEQAVFFTDYLRRYLAGGGFRGLSDGTDRHRLTRDLQPI